MKINWKFRALLYAGCVSLPLSAPAHAQGVEAAGQPASSVGEVIVTANKRAQNVIDVSASISAIKGTAIEAARIKGVEDLKFVEPSLQVTTQSSDEQYIGIRGSYTNTDAPAAEQGVAVFIDDVATTGPDDLTEDYFDLDRVEVLRGPQGTLFGRNVTGGVISIFTTRPSYTPELRVAGTYGNYNQRELQALVTGPLIADRVAGKLTVDFLAHDGFLHNVTLSDQAGGIDHIAVRGELRFDIRDNLHLIVGAGLFHDHSQGDANTLVGSGQPMGPPFYDPAAAPVHLAYGPWYTNQGDNGHNHRDNDNAFARLDWGLGFGTLTSISGFRQVRSSNLSSGLGDPGDFLLFGPQDRDKQLTEEIRLTSPDRHRLTWIVGAYYINSDKYRALNYITPYPADLVGPFADGGVQAQRDILNSVSAFGEVGYDVLPSLNLTLGARETYEHKGGYAVQSGGALFPVPAAQGGCSNPPSCAPTKQSDSWAAFTPKATLTYKPSEHLHAYFTVSRGFKGGGFDYVGLTPEQLAKPYAPEYATNYELGVKTSLFDGRLSIDADVYREDYSNLQVRQNFLAGTIVTSEATNVGKARVQGFELDATFRPTHRSQIGVNYAYTDFRYLNYILNNGTGDTSGTVFKCVDPACTMIDLSGHQAGITPRHSAAVFGQLDIPLPDEYGHLNLYADVAYRSAVWTDAFNNDAPFLRKLTQVNGLVNANVNWTPENQRYRISFWVKNLTKLRSVVPLVNISGAIQQLYGLGPNDSVYLTQATDPRTFGVTLEFDFK